LAPEVDYAPLPKSLLDKAKAQVKQVGSASSSSGSSTSTT
jgi:hypothetical protein